MSDEGKKIQVKDISDAEILDCCQKVHTRAGETPDIALAYKYPVKVIMRKMQQMVERGLLEYGVSLRTAWVVSKPVTGEEKGK